MIRQAVRLACCIRAAGFVFITWSRVSISKTASVLMGSEKPMVPLASFHAPFHAAGHASRAIVGEDVGGPFLDEDGHDLGCGLLGRDLCRVVQQWDGNEASPSQLRPKTLPAPGMTALSAS